MVAFGDVVLRQSDYALLQENQWLNDTCICFALEHMRLVDFKHLIVDTCSPVSNQDKRACILDPSVSFMLMQLPSDAAAMQLQSAGATSASLVLLPVNDNADVNVAHGGSHWSMLALRRYTAPGAEEGVVFFEHFDSYSGSNEEPAHQLAASITAAMALPTSGVHFLERQVPQQRNASDCGVFVVSYTRAILRTFENETALPLSNALHEECEDISATERRKQLRDLVHQLGSSEK